MAININFKIVEINRDIGTILVEYLADGATKEKFGAQAGPYQINIPNNFSSMTEQEVKDHIASIGVSIVQYQKEVLDSEVSGKFDLLQNMIGQDNVSVQGQ